MYPNKQLQETLISRNHPKFSNKFNIKTDIKTSNLSQY
uniref:Uncharacterized protein n=1 Tax=Rhizophora mucronata TaxID=61149 RepID=A0A2P2PXE8_RHIMU